MHPENQSPWKHMKAHRPWELRLLSLGLQNQKCAQSFLVLAGWDLSPELPAGPECDLSVKNTEIGT